MYNMHTTVRGDRLMICQMSDDHLRNTIMKSMKAIEMASAMASGSGRTSVEFFLNHKNTIITPEQAARKIEDILNSIYPYLSEAFLREGFSDVQDVLRSVLGRSSQVFPLVPLLPEPTIKYRDGFSATEYDEDNIS